MSHYWLSELSLAVTFWDVVWGWGAVATDLSLKSGKTGQDTESPGNSDKCFYETCLSIYIGLFNYIIYVCFAMKANLASSSSYEGVAFGRRNYLLTEKLCGEVEAAGVLCWRPKESGSVSLPRVFFYFGGCCNRCKRGCMDSPVCLCCNTYGSCNFLSLPFWMDLLSVLFSYFGSNISCYQNTSEF